MEDTAERESLHNELLKVLKLIDFGNRYLSCYVELTGGSGQHDYRIDLDNVSSILSETGLSFRYFTKEKFFGYLEKHKQYDLFFHITLRRSAAEFSLYLGSDRGVIGGLWSDLAQQITREPHTEVDVFHESRGLPFSSETGLRHVIESGVTTFRHARDLIWPHFDWLTPARESC
ncbi:hypothetical protein F3087_40070 [Nocardia colli]|uniref:Uncharacterized protein n=1 Tax=Nocardia colli TaxID=2545717 RepID=A0A5N0DZQ8_9NOCA|nr:hypothetical protein [Nocardia colli]KAA8881870.1 hypothetical protein F3087_40070 [Nocardia colli]